MLISTPANVGFGKTMVNAKRIAPESSFFISSFTSSTVTQEKPIAVQSGKLSRLSLLPSAG
jgi:hypothetical protein